MIDRLETAIVLFCSNDKLNKPVLLCFFFFVCLFVCFFFFGGGGRFAICIA